MEHLKKIKLLMSQKDTRKHCIITILCLYLLMKACTHLAYSSASSYQTYKDLYYYVAVAYFLVVLILIRRVSFLNAPVLATIAVYTIASVRYFIECYTVAAYGVNNQKAMVVKCIAWGLFLIILADIIRTGKRTCYNKQNTIFSLITLIAFSLAFALRFQDSLSVFCPIAALYLTPISKKQWIWFVECFTVAYYGACVWVITKSLIAIPPYTVLSDRWYYMGIFPSPWTGGIFCAGALACVMYWFLKFWTADKRNIVLVGVCILAMVFPVYATLLFASRSAQLGVLGCALFTFIFAASKNEKNNWKKRGIGVLTAIVVAAAGAIVLLRCLLNVDVDSIRLPEGMLRYHFMRWVAVARKSFAGQEAWDFFPKDSVLSVIDGLSSNRLCILVQTLKNVSLFGSKQLEVLVGEIYYHPHNTYTAWLLMYGWLGGIPMIVWFFSFLVKSVRGVLKRELIYLFPFLWGALLTFAMLPEYLHWMYPTAFVLFFVQYPLLIEQAETEDEKLPVCHGWSKYQL